MNETIQMTVTIIGAGVAAYVGVRVAIAEIRGEIKRHEDRLNNHEGRLDRLEKPYFTESSRQDA